MVDERLVAGIDQRGRVNWDAIPEEDTAQALLKRQSGREGLNWRTLFTMVSLMVWLVASMMVPIPRVTDPGDEAAARILAFVSGALLWLLAGALVHLCARKFSPNAGMSIVAGGTMLFAGFSAAGAIAHHAPTSYHDRATDLATASDIAVRNTTHDVARAVINRVGFGTRVSEPAFEPVFANVPETP